MPRLISLSFRDRPSAPGFPNSGTGNTIRIGASEGSFVNWHVAVRGPTVLIASPAGWNPSEQPGAKISGRTVFEIPRANLTLKWEYAPDESVEATKEWTQPAPEVVELRSAAAVAAGYAGGVSLAADAALLDDRDQGDEPIVAARGKVPARRA